MYKVHIYKRYTYIYIHIEHYAIEKKTKQQSDFKSVPKILYFGFPQRLHVRKKNADEEVTNNKCSHFVVQRKKTSPFLYDE